MPKPRGRIREFDYSTRIRLDRDLKTWLSTMSSITEMSEAAFIRAVLNSWKTGDCRHVDHDGKSDRLEP